MLNCKRATALMSQGLDRKLSISQKMGLKLHMMMCSGCRNFNRQMAFLRQGCRKFPPQDD